MKIDKQGIFRIIGAGSTTLSDGTEVTALTFTRKPKERVMIAAWVTDDVAGASTDWANETPGASAINLYIRRTATVQQGRLRIENKSGQTRTVQWTVLGLKS